MKRTYTPWQEWKHPSKQTEYTEPTTLLAEDGTLLSPGWAATESKSSSTARSGTSISSPTATTWSS